MGKKEVDEDFEAGGPMMSTPQKRRRAAREEPQEEEGDEDDEEEEEEAADAHVEPFGDVDLNLDEDVELDIDTEFDKVDKGKGKGRGGMAGEPVPKKRKDSSLRDLYEVCFLSMLFIHDSPHVKTILWTGFELEI